MAHQNNEGKMLEDYAQKQAPLPVIPPAIESKAIEKLASNLTRLQSFYKLEFGWNGYDAEPLSANLIDRCATYVQQLGAYQPDIFPTGRGSIQFEYEHNNRGYLEIEIYPDKVSLYRVFSNVEETEKDGITWNEALTFIAKYHATNGTQ